MLAKSGILTFLARNDLKARCIRSSAILGGTAVVTRAVGLGSKMLLTRILLPSEMGLAVVLMAITTFFEAIAEVGIKQSVIQNRKGADNEYVNTAWWFQVARAVLLYALAVFMVPHACHFYFADKADVLAQHDWPTLRLMLYVSCLSLLFNGFISPRAYVLEKEFHFARAAAIDQGAFLAGTAVTVTLTLVTRSIWGMILGFIGTSLSRCVLSHALAPFRPRMEFHKESLESLLRFGKGVFGLPLLTYLVLNIDLLILGRLAQAWLVGMYGMAAVLARAPQDLYGKVVNPVLLPLFSAKQEESAAIGKIVNRIAFHINLIGVPLLVLAGFLGGTLLSLAYGHEYRVVSTAFSLICVSVLFHTHATLFTNVLVALGHPEKQRLWCLIVSGVAAVTCYPMVIWWGEVGAAIAIVVSHFIGMIVQVIMTSRMIQVSVKSYVASYGARLLLGVVVLIVGFML